jgi:hypothetical protein
MAALGRTLGGHAGWPAVAPGLVSCGVLVSMGVADGGLFPRAWRLGTLALTALAVAALLARTRVALGRREWLVVGALAAYAGWIAVSAAWSGRAATSFVEAERALVYATGMLAALLVTERASVRQLLGGVVAGTTAATAYGLWIYLFTSPPLDPVEGALLFQPLGYANALGIFVAVAALLCVGLALCAETMRGRAVALAPLALLGPALYLTSSRGAWLAFAAGLLVLLRFSGRLSVRLATALAAVAAVAVVGVVAASGAGENRVHYYRVAWQDFLDHPLLGSGGGTFGAYWLEHRTVDLFVRTPHSLYLGSLAELGVVGLAIAMVAVVPPLLVLRGRRDPLVATAGAAYAAFVLHAGIDWDWEVPAVTLSGVFCGAGLLVAGRSRTPRPLGARGRVGTIVVLAAFAVLACVRFRTGSQLPFGP